MTAEFHNPEYQLLITVARKGINFEGVDLIENLIKQHINWGYLLLLANHHGMLPLLYLALKAIDQELIPVENGNFLKDFYFENTQRNISLLGELLKLINLLKENNILAVPFKGPTLSNQLYRNYTIRQAGDIDILVKPEDALAVVEILEEQGFNLLPSLSKNQRLALVNVSRENVLVLFRHQNKLLVEVHWRVYISDLIGRNTTSFIWDHMEPINVNNVSLYVFKPEISFLLLCFHNYKHTWDRLFWIWELWKIINQEQRLDWGWILNHAHIFGSQTILFLNLIVMDKLFGIKIPTELRKKIYADQKAVQIFKQIKFEPLKNDIEVLDGFKSVSLFNRFKIKGNFLSRVKQVINFTLTPNFYDIQSIDLPPFLHFLYYLMRPFRLGYKFILKWFSS